MVEVAARWAQDEGAKVTMFGNGALARAAFGLLLVLSTAGVTTTLLPTAPAAAAGVAPISLGAAQLYSVHGGTGVTNAGASTISGDVGVSPGAAATLTGFPPGLIYGSTHANDADAAAAAVAIRAAYDDAASRTPTRTFTGDQNAQTFGPGVHHTVAAFALTGTMTLDGQGDPNAIFIFKVDAALNTAAASVMQLTNGAQAKNVFWQVVGAVGMGASCTFVGTVMSAAAVTVGASSVLSGSVFGRGLVTLGTVTITTPAALTISVPTTPTDLGSFPNKMNGSVVSGALGAVQVIDQRGSAAGGGWVVTVTCTAFSNSGGQLIPASAVRYAVGSIGQTGTATFTPNDPNNLTAVVPALTASAITGNNTATWNPRLILAIPGGATLGTYTATVTHSVV